MTSDPPLTLATEEETKQLSAIYGRLSYDHSKQARQEMNGQLRPILLGLGKRHGIAEPDELIIGVFPLDFRLRRPPRVHVALIGQAPRIPGIEWAGPLRDLTHAG